ncbi:amino acid permease [Lapidilactobacillus dextrinicus DSM 20335]|uniref:Amino acid permease n=1 Tax=Lapidilactobacillus dextrinicus DSM 20335 TaxID=1423738 RepID=A0A0R2BKI6_9LACO|nr:amino acid permease [Lapidilactobacillus dextrinicus]KRM79889.1 amino acid permease [Lapidilactobacillus dextrinicus DSM 20335]QFG46328.1 amino acid permease [Lapidilactobacillus dextrinicus]
MHDHQSPKKLLWYNLTLIGFVSIWGLGNVVNNFAEEGLVVVISWLIIMALYFIPYALMVGQLGSTFNADSGGVSSWIKEVANKRLAYLAAWTYWVVNVTYLAQKSQSILIAGSWLFKGNGDFVNETSSTIVQLLCLVVFLVFLYLASRGITTINRIGTIAGLSMLVMSILFIFLGLSAPALTGAKFATANMNQISTYIPKFDFKYFTTISMLIFAVGGSDKLSPYVNKMKKPAKDFPKGLIVLAMLVVVSALMGSFAMGMIFDAQHIPADLMANGAYVAFQRLGQYYHLGNLLMIIYALANALATIAALAVSIDAPLRILLDDADPQFVPNKLRQKNQNGVPINGYKLTGVLVSVIILIPAIGISGTNNLYNWLLNLNSVVMPLRFLWVFLAFMLLNKHLNKFKSEYVFVRNPKIGFLIGLWCFVFTAFACILGMVPKMSFAADPAGWWFQLILNIATPIFLIGLGFILPALARRKNEQLISK